jgi:hypothetical protein
MNGNSTSVCCENCYFRRAGLCALQLTEACPTFRPHQAGAITREPPIRLAPRPLAEIVRPKLISQPAAA